ncbi:MAG: hypothetical protein NDJ92_06960 [Thermoanaerobaculia bacterium]|nr:hypothetical protein [Thermoanaerobaculia bacterium]
MAENESTPAVPAQPAAEGGTASVKERIEKAREFVGERYQAVSDKVKTKYDSASTATREKVAEIKQRVEGIEVDDVAEQMRDYVRSNPGKALLISIGVGFVIGLLVRGTGDDD